MRPTRSTRSLRAATLVVVAGLTALCLAVPAHADDSVPFNDPNAKGTITLCNARGEQMTSGRLADLPFVYRAIGDLVPPAAYRGDGAKATLYAFQPREHIDPTDWSGEQLTAASVYSKPKVPIAAATTLDPTMLAHVQGFPAVWNGLVQLRLLLSAPGQPLLQIPYAAAVIQVDGKNWRVVQGGNVSCWAGKAISQATLSLPEDSFPKVTEGPAYAGTDPVTSPSPGVVNNPAPSPSDFSASEFADPLTAGGVGAGASSGSSAAPTIIGLMGLALLLALGVLAAVLWRRPRPAGR